MVVWRLGNCSTSLSPYLLVTLAGLGMFDRGCELGGASGGQACSLESSFTLDGVTFFGEVYQMVGYILSKPEPEAVTWGNEGWRKGRNFLGV